MKKNVFYLFGIIHIFLIGCVASYNCYNSYCEFYSKKQNSKIMSYCKKIITTKPVIFYGRYAGIETGYGFFAPNVRSRGEITFEINGKNNTPEFKTNEGYIRYQSLCSDLVLGVLTSSDSTNSTKDGIKKIREKYFDILNRNMAVKVINTLNTNTDTVMLHYNLLMYPSLQDKRKLINIKLEKQEVKLLKFAIRNEKNI